MKMIVSDFVRCQRADGSFYGTGGRCQKGREVGELVKPIGAGKKNLDLAKLVEKGKPIGEGADGMVFDVGGGMVIKQGTIPQSEVRIMEKLRGVEGVPRVLGHDPQQPLRNLLAMDKVQGDPLVKLSREDKAKAWDDAFRVMSGIHKSGVAHNDLHGGNVLYDKTTGKSSVIDFGKSQDTLLAVVNELGSLYGKTKDDFYNATGPRASRFAANYEKMYGNRYFLSEKKDYGKRKELTKKWIGEVWEGV